MAKNKSPLNVTVDADLLAQLKEWMRDQVVEPTMSATVEKAIKDLLDKHGGKPKKD